MVMGRQGREKLFEVGLVVLVSGSGRREVCDCVAFSIVCVCAHGLAYLCCQRDVSLDMNLALSLVVAGNER